jgi:hypothetical protein
VAVFESIRRYRQGRFSYENSDIVIGEVLRHPFFANQPPRANGAPASRIELVEPAAVNGAAHLEAA